MTLTILFISEMVARHKRVLGYIPGKYIPFNICAFGTTAFLGEHCLIHLCVDGFPWHVEHACCVDDNM